MLKKTTFSVGNFFVRKGEITIFRKYIWLGYSKFEGNVYWDKKKECALKGGYSTNFGKKYTLFLIPILIVLFRTIIYFIDHKFDRNSEINSFFVCLLAIFIGISLTLFINFSLYGNKKYYTDTSIKDALYAIQSIGYLNNPFIIMLLDRKLEYLVLALVLLSCLFWSSSLITISTVISELLRLSTMILFCITLIYVIYLVNFKKNKGLKL